MNDNNKVKLNFYGNIITKIAIAAILFWWIRIDGRLQDLETRMRSLELKVTAISVRLGIETDAMLSSSHPGPQQEHQHLRGQTLR